MKSVHLYIHLLCCLSTILVWGQVHDFDDNDDANSSQKIIPKIDYRKFSSEKININYQFLSFPNLSKFDPVKGDYTAIKNTTKTTTQNQRFLSLNYGTFNAPLIDFNIWQKMSEHQKIYFDVHHYSSTQSIPITLPNDIANTYTNIKHILSKENYTLQNSFYWQQHSFNWYGIDTDVFKENIYSNIDLRQTHNLFEWNIDYQNKHIKSLRIRNNIYLDKLKNSEVNSIINLLVKIPVEKQFIFLNTDINLLSSRVGNAVLENRTNSAIVTLSPFVVFGDERYQIKAGTSMSTGISSAGNTQALSIFPLLNISYEAISKYLVFYGGVKGHYLQNNYQKFLRQNLYVNPTVNIRPTNLHFDIKAGIQGEILELLNYNIRVDFLREEFKPIFVKTTNLPIENESFSYGNSFNISYADISSFMTTFELTYTIDHLLHITWNTQFTAYSNNDKRSKKVLNLPNIQSNIIGNIKIKKKWNLSTNLHFEGVRNGLVSDGLESTIITYKNIELDEYINWNTELGYEVSKSIEPKIKLNNILNNTQAKWYGYQRQGFQVLLGINLYF